MNEHDQQEPAAASAPPMPPDAAAAAGAADAGDDAVPPPPSFGRQAAQLIVIPAVIVIAAIGVATLFALLGGREQSIEQQLDRLRQSSGQGRLALGMQDPRYKDRGLAAANIAQMLPSIEDPQKRAAIAEQLVDILNTRVGEEEDLLKVYLLIAIGQIGREGSFEVVAGHLDAPREKVRQGAIRGVLSWPRRDEAQQALPKLRELAVDPDVLVRAEAAAALGELADEGDQSSIAALHRTMQHPAREDREAVWNAAVALARLEDEAGSQYVAGVLLDRAALAQLPAEEQAGGTSRTLSRAAQDRVILSTLAGADTMSHPAVWARIRRLAKDDPSLAVKKAAEQLLAEPARQTQESQ